MTNDQEKSIERIKTKFKRKYPNSHIIISREISFNKSGDTDEWSVYMVIDEDPESNPIKKSLMLASYKEVSAFIYDSFRKIDIQLSIEDDEDDEDDDDDEEEEEEYVDVVIVG